MAIAKSDEFSRDRIAGAAVPQEISPVVQDAFANALRHHLAGRLNDAERLYRQILQSESRHADSLHLLGVIAQQVGRYDVAVELIGNAIKIDSGVTAYHSNLGVALQDLGRFDEAVAAFNSAIRLEPNYAEGHSNLGNALKGLGRVDDAIAAFTAAIRLKPDYAEGHYNLAVALQGFGCLDDAVAAYVTAIRLKPDLAEAYSNLGIVFKELGRFDAAAATYNKAIRLKPHYAEAYSNLSTVLQALNRLDEAIAASNKAILLKPNLAEAYSNLGTALQELRRFDDALSAYPKAIRLNSGFAETHANLGTALKETGHPDAAVPALKAAICLKPSSAEAYSNLGTAVMDLGRAGDAVVAYNIALRLKPNLAEAHYNLGTAVQELGRFDDAVAAYKTAIRLKSDYADAHSNLGITLREVGRPDGAVAALNMAICLKPDLAEAHANLGSLLTDMVRLDDAVAACRRAIRLKPEFAEAYSNLGAAQKELASLDDAVTAFNLAIHLKPDLADAHSNLLFAMLYTPSFSAEAIGQAQLRSAASLYDGLTDRHRPHTNRPDPRRRLRLGFVSADLRRHPVTCFLEPVLRHLDKASFEIFAYANQVTEDHITVRIKGEVDHWVGLIGLSDEAAAERIRADGIDLLIDLSGHTAGQRLGVFALKPAPVQVTWLGHPSSTGLAAMDYRLTDASCDPVGLTDHLGREALWRLPEAFCCYRPDDGSPEPVETLPADANGFFTFGCCTNLAKLSAPVIALWSRLLRRVPGAKLLLEIKGIGQPALRRRLEAVFGGHGIGPERLILIDRIGQPQYQLYKRIDLGLDPFPYNGGTSSFDSLWMGVPFVTLAGGHSVSRLGASLLATMDLHELIAADEDAYITVAAGLAEEHSDRLRQLRDGLRPRLQASPLMDATRFTRHFEDALRAMWQNWCGQQ